MRLTVVHLFVFVLICSLNRNAWGDEARVLESRASGIEGPSGTEGPSSGAEGPSGVTPPEAATLMPIMGSRRGVLRLGQGHSDSAAAVTGIPDRGFFSVAKARARLNQNQTVVEVVCGEVKCGHHEVCIFKPDLEKHVCVQMKGFRASRRHGHIHAHAHDHGHDHGHGRFHGNHGHGHVFHARAKVFRKPNDTELEKHRRIQKLKVHAKEFQDRHDQRFKLSVAATDKAMKLRTKKFIDGNNGENNTSDKWNKECRLREMDGIGRRLLDQFKMNQDKDVDQQKSTNRRRKEKRNSTKKELHDDDECICQAPVSWQFQQLDANTDGHLSRSELASVTTQGVCFSQFVVSCDHDRDGNLSEKEWCCCFADILPPCLALTKNVPTVLVRGVPMVLPGAFVPRCDDEGFFSQVQCHSGACWCVDRNGVRSDSSATTGNPQCDSPSTALPVAQI